ncbi:substrate-binding domain-containing protein [Arthrobacter sp. SLBN-112]|uniref:substrate-binding domain-containing protein n=1 Tax=Arthrobacter sp. SLBN-112 TaxID=2768452 RepID=UPI0027B710DC|nr:substrate-binding domain-containing protein [Arthrobacter sp. SLBN-112]MDQ0799016.1 ribose transport system substrate-binding protein [Arthrobacter sp. SLBN-112]
MKTSANVAVIAFAASLAFLTGCGSSPQTGSSDNEPLQAVDAATLVPNDIVGRGPDGVKSGNISDLNLTTEEVAKAKSEKYKVGIVMQTMNVEWSTEQVRGITDRLKEFNAEVVGVIDPDYNVEKQIAGIENMIQKKPDAILSIPVDDTATAEAYKKIGAAGIKLILMDNIPKGLKYPTDYQSIVSSDNQGNGAVAAKALAEYIPTGGSVGVLDFGVDFFVTKERKNGFTNWMKENRPDIVVKVTEFLDPAKAGDTASNFLTANPDVKGMYTEWEVPAMGIESALRNQGKNLPITSVNIASDVAIDLANGGMIKGFGAQVPYDQGMAEASAAINALLGKSVPQWIAFKSVPVIRNNVLDAWKQVYHQDPPADLVKTCNDNAACRK